MARRPSGTGFPRPWFWRHCRRRRASPRAGACVGAPNGTHRVGFNASVPICLTARRRVRRRYILWARGTPSLRSALSSQGWGATRGFGRGAGQARGPSHTLTYPPRWTSTGSRIRQLGARHLWRRALARVLVVKPNGRIAPLCSRFPRGRGMRGFDGHAHSSRGARGLPRRGGEAHGGQGG